MGPIVQELRTVAERYVQVGREARFWGLVTPEEYDRLDIEALLELEAILDEGLRTLRSVIAWGQADFWKAAYGGR